MKYLAHFPSDSRGKKMLCSPLIQVGQRQHLWHSLYIVLHRPSAGAFKPIESLNSLSRCHSMEGDTQLDTRGHHQRSFSKR
jgi:hypothetical protein